MINNISDSVPYAGNTLTLSNNNYNEVVDSLSQSVVTPTKTKNITGDPMFVNESTGKEDYHLRKQFFCVDAGLNTAPNMPLTDIEGETRPQDGDKDGTATTNMGCYETLGGSFSWTMFLPGIIGGGN
ncbi:MAG: hypothetical protein OEM01_10360 [Desulfobulbaceae bacterium]|nr:hypothetical protein [Desulfobulbaceae bacterium]